MYLLALSLVLVCAGLWMLSNIVELISVGGYPEFGRVQAEGDKLKTPKFGKLFELLITFEIVSQSQKSLVHLWVIVVRTGCLSQILLITPNLRLTAVFVTFREGSFAIITFDLEP